MSEFMHEYEFNLFGRESSYKPHGQQDNGPYVAEHDRNASEAGLDQQNGRRHAHMQTDCSQTMLPGKRGRTNTAVEHATRDKPRYALSEVECQNAHQPDRCNPWKQVIQSQRANGTFRSAVRGDR